MSGSSPGLIRSESVTTRVRPGARAPAWLVAVAVLAAAGDGAAQAPGKGAGAAGRPGGAGAAARPGAAGAADSDAVEAARQHFHRGVELTAAGRLAEALVEFQAAYDQSPTYRILYNIGQVSRHVGDHARSLRAFERYLAEGGDEIDRLDKGRRAEVDGEIASQRALVGALWVRVDEGGAAVLLDGARIGEAPLDGPVYVNPGVHRVRAERAGRAPATEIVEVAAGQSIDVALRLAPVPAPSAARLPPPPPGGSRPTWIGWVATGALAAGAGVTGAIALVSSSELSDARYAGPDRRPPPGSEVSALSDRVDTLAVVTDVLAGAAVVSLGITLYLTLSEPPPAPARAGAAAAGRRLVVGAGARGAWIGGAF